MRYGPSRLRKHITKTGVPRASRSCAEPHVSQPGERRAAHAVTRGNTYITAGPPRGGVTGTQLGWGETATPATARCQITAAARSRVISLLIDGGRMKKIVLGCTIALFAFVFAAPAPRSYRLRHGVLRHRGSAGRHLERSRTRARGYGLRGAVIPISHRERERPAHV